MPKDRTTETGQPLARVEQHEASKTPNPWVTPAQYDDFTIRWWQSNAKGKEGEFYTQRMGQAFCNEFDISDTQLFYTTKVSRTVELMELYIQTPDSDEKQ